MPEEFDGMLLETQQSGIAVLEKAIEILRSGEAESLLMVTLQRPDDTYWVASSLNNDRHKAAGMLLEMAVAEVA